MLSEPEGLFLRVLALFIRMDIGGEYLSSGPVAAGRVRVASELVRAIQYPAV
jgi:hypothetical protein